MLHLLFMNCFTLFIFTFTTFCSRAPVIVLVSVTNLSSPLRRKITNFLFETVHLFRGERERTRFIIFFFSWGKLRKQQWQKHKRFAWKCVLSNLTVMKRFVWCATEFVHVVGNERILQVFFLYSMRMSTWKVVIRRKNLTHLLYDARGASRDRAERNKALMRLHCPAIVSLTKCRSFIVNLLKWLYFYSCFVCVCWIHLCHKVCCCCCWFQNSILPRVEVTLFMNKRKRTIRSLSLGEK